MMTTRWSWTAAIIAFCCLTLNYSYNASSLSTEALGGSSNVTVSGFVFFQKLCSGYG